MSPLKFSSLVILFVSLLIGAVFLGEKLYIKKEPIRIGINPWPGYELLFLSETIGLYEEEGIDVEFVEISSLSDILHVFHNNKIDVFCGTISEFIESNARGGRPSKIILIPDYSDGGDVILAKSGVDSVADLRGKKVGLERTVLGSYMLARALEKHSMTLDDVQRVYYDQELLGSLIGNGEVEAVVSYAPFSIEMKKKYDLSPIFDSADIPGDIIDVVAIAEDAIPKYEEEIAKIMEVWDKVVLHAHTHFDTASQLMAKRENISHEEFLQAYSGVKILSSEQQKQMIRRGEISFVVNKMKNLMLPEEQRYILMDSSEYIHESLVSE